MNSPRPYKMPTKPTMFRRVRLFLSEWDYAVMLAAPVVLGGLIAGYIIYTDEPVQYLQAPVGSCKRTYTGQQKAEGYYTYICGSYDKNMACTAQLPVYNEYTYQEVNNQCNWNEWQ